MEDHASRCVKAAKKMLTLLEKRNEKSGIKWHLRIGIHLGPITAGVVGKRNLPTIFLVTLLILLVE